MQFSMVSSAGSHGKFHHIEMIARKILCSLEDVAKKEKSVQGSPSQLPTTFFDTFLDKAID